jgi:hypothetical protein
MGGGPGGIASQATIWSVPEHDDFPEGLRGTPVVVVAGVYAGPVEEGERAFQPLRELDTPVLDLSDAGSYTHLQQQFDPFFPEGDRYYWKSRYLAHLDDDAIETIVEYGENRPSPRTIVPVRARGGKLGRIDPSATAFADRHSPFLLSIDSTWDDPTDSEENIQWTREVWEDMHRFSDGGLYLNFPGFGEEGEELVRAGHGEKIYDRLVALKDEYDPDNVFRLNGNVEPSG